MNTKQADTTGCTVEHWNRPLWSVAAAAVLALVVCTNPAQACCGLNVGSGSTVTIASTLITDCVNVAVGGKIIVSAGGTLVLNGSGGCNTSTIDGRIQLAGSSSMLRIVDNSHTFNGSGCIEGQNDSAEIEISSGLTLTSTTTIEGALTIDANSATLTNNGRLVANYNDESGNETLLFYRGTVNGSGEWEVSASGAVLQLGVNLLSASTSGTIRVYDGTLDADISATGTGGLCQTGGEIQVAATKTVTISGTPSGPCP